MMTDPDADRFLFVISCSCLRLFRSRCCHHYRRCHHHWHIRSQIQVRHSLISNHSTGAMRRQVQVVTSSFRRTDLFSPLRNKLGACCGHSNCHLPVNVGRTEAAQARVGRMLETKLSLLNLTHMLREMHNYLLMPIYSTLFPSIVYSDRSVQS